MLTKLNKYYFRIIFNLLLILGLCFWFYDFKNDETGFYQYTKFVNSECECHSPRECLYGCYDDFMKIHDKNLISK